MNRINYLDKMLQSRKRTNKRKAEQSACKELYPNGYFHEKACLHCGKLFTPKAPSELYCCDYCKDYGLTEAYYKRVYGLTLQEYLDIAEAQNFQCAICHKENFAMGVNHSGCLVVDHDHQTGAVRGLLCHNCNRALGLLQDSINYLRSAAKYLESVTTIPKGSTPKQVEAVEVSTD